MIRETKTQRSVLVVDDEPDVLDVFKNILGSLGYRVSLESSSVKALEIIKRNDYDLIITDLIMPEMNGLELLQVIKSENRNIPVIITAGIDIKDIDIDAGEFGEIEFIKKPFTINDIKQKLRRQFTDKVIVNH
ncbi:MAG: response regulator [candidate division Zixibacteria bacterium]|nr:response regulator [candidate division Zixibacteria bacterium]